MEEKNGKNLSVHLMLQGCIIPKIEEKIYIPMVFWKGRMRKWIKIVRYMIFIPEEFNRWLFVIFGCILLSEIVTVN